MKKTIIIILGILMVLGVVGVGYFYWRDKNTESEKIVKENSVEKIDNSKVENTNTNTKEDASVENLDCEIALKYVSEKLGIAFCYPKMLGERKVEVIEEENKIYVDGKQGQYVEVFDKNPNDELNLAIEKQFLQDYDKNKCWVEMATSKNLSPSLFKNPDHIFAKPIMYEVDLSIGLPNNQFCPQPYSMTNGINYFMMDKNNLDRFFFFSIGQYAIPLNPDDMANSKTWQETITVFAKQ